MNNSVSWHDRFFQAVSQNSDLEAVQWSQGTLVYGALRARALAYAAYLQQQGFVKGDRVAVALKSEPALLVALLGHYLLGLIHVPINTRYGRRELSHIIDDCNPKAIWCDPNLECAEELKEIARDGEVPVWEDLMALENVTPATAVLPAVADHEVAMLIYTSGTTGLSKGCALSYRAVFSNIWNLSRAWRFTSADRLVVSLPLFHVHGLCLALHSAFFHGAKIILHERFSASAVVESFARDGATAFMGVPTMYHRLLKLFDASPKAAKACRNARLFASGSAPLPPKDFEAFEAHTGHRILERYGMSETLLTLSNPYEGERKPGTVGFPVAGVTASIRDEQGVEVGAGVSGTLWVKGENVMNEYWQNPQATAQEMQDGYFRTGDCVVRDEEGYFRIVGRESVDVLKVGGFKVGAREIEEALETHPSIDEAAVVGLPDDEWGQTVAAYVVWNSNAPVPPDAMQKFLQELIAGYKIPRTYWAVTSLPRNALGKLQKHRLADLQAQAHRLQDRS